jgi:hypothetical protein
MPYIPHKGSCLLIPFNDVPHLFVILNNPCPDGLCLTVMLTSIKPSKKHDSACEFVGGEHEFITKPCFALYRLADQLAARHISNMVEKGYYKEKEDLSEDQIVRIIKGLFSSDETRSRFVKYANAIAI